MAGKRILLLAGAALLSGLLFCLLIIGGTHAHDKHGLARWQVRRVGAAVDQYRADVGAYPADIEQLIGPTESGTKWSGPYISRFHILDPWNRPLYYRVENDGRSFVLFTLGKDGRIGGDDADADFGARLPDAGAPDGR